MTIVLTFFIASPRDLGTPQNTLQKYGVKCLTKSQMVF